MASSSSHDAAGSLAGADDKSNSVCRHWQFCCCSVGMASQADYSPGRAAVVLLVALSCCPGPTGGGTAGRVTTIAASRPVRTKPVDFRHTHPLT